jgi:hypothetical protein
MKQHMGLSADEVIRIMLAQTKNFWEDIKINDASQNFHRKFSGEFQNC